MSNRIPDIHSTGHADRCQGKVSEYCVPIGIGVHNSVHNSTTKPTMIQQGTLADFKNKGGAWLLYNGRGAPYAGDRSCRFYTCMLSNLALIVIGFTLVHPDQYKYKNRMGITLDQGPLKTLACSCLSSRYLVDLRSS